VLEQQDQAQGSIGPRPRASGVGATDSDTEEGLEVDFRHADGHHLGGGSKRVGGNDAEAATRVTWRRAVDEGNASKGTAPERTARRHGRAGGSEPTSCGGGNVATAKVGRPGPVASQPCTACSAGRTRRPSRDRETAHPGRGSLDGDIWDRGGNTTVYTALPREASGAATAGALTDAASDPVFGPGSGPSSWQARLRTLQRWSHRHGRARQLPPSRVDAARPGRGPRQDVLARTGTDHVGSLQPGEPHGRQRGATDPQRIVWRKPPKP
jgi:hypothetical protein